MDNSTTGVNQRRRTATSANRDSTSSGSNQTNTWLWTKQWQTFFRRIQLRQTHSARRQKLSFSAEQLVLRGGKVVGDCLRGLLRGCFLPRCVNCFGNAFGDSRRRWWLGRRRFSGSSAATRLWSDNRLQMWSKISWNLLMGWFRREKAKHRLPENQRTLLAASESPRLSSLRECGREGLSLTLNRTEHEFVTSHFHDAQVK